mgnify:CR=1 FL=1
MKSRLRRLKAIKLKSIRQVERMDELEKELR